MTAPGASAYLPVLGDCLDGTTQLVSWKDAYICIRDDIYLESSGPVQDFLSDPQTFHHLANIDHPFLSESADAKSAFDKAASAINAPASASGSYDISQIKEDALWLSKEAGISQLAALRLVVLALQQQPENDILRDVQQSEDTAATLSFQKSALLQSVLGQRPTEPTGDARRTDSLRRGMLLELLVSEQQYIVKNRELVAHSKLSKAKPGPEWLREIGQRLVTAWLGEEGQGFEGAFIQVVKRIETTIDGLRSGLPWLHNEESSNDRLTALWYEGCSNEIVHDLSLLLHMVQYRTEAMSSPIIISWFEFMGKTAWFNQPETIDLSLSSLQAQAIQSLVALISTAVLQAGVAMSTMSELSVEGPTQAPTRGFYLRDANCVEILTAIMAKSLEINPLPAGPAMLTWAMILFRLRYFAKEASETRESRSAQRAIEFTQAADSDTDSIDSMGIGNTRDRRRSSFGSDGGQPTTLVETIWDVAQKVAYDDDISDALFQGAHLSLSAFEIIAQITTEFCESCCDAFGGLFGVEARLIFFDLCKTANSHLPYDSDVVETMLTVLGRAQPAELRYSQCAKFPQVHPVHAFVNDEKCSRAFLDIARSRFPKEYAPFLAFCQCLSPIRSNDPEVESHILQYLRDLKTITTTLSEQTGRWEVKSDSEQGNIELLSDLEVLPNILDFGTAENLQLNRRLLGNQVTSATPYFVTAGTEGQTLSERKPLVVMWDYNYSGLAFVGSVLQVASDLWMGEKAGKLEAAHADIVHESLGLLASILESADSAAAAQILGDCSENLGESADVVQVVFEIFESLLYRSVIDHALSGILVSCVDLIRQFVKFVPGRVWPFMGRSGLLGIDKVDSRLRAILASNEIPSGQFPFLTGSVNLFRDLIEDAITNCLKRKSSSKAVTRFQSLPTNTNGTGITEPAVKRILGQFQALLIDVFESCQNWRFQKTQEKTCVMTTLLTTMDRVLVYYNDVDDSSDPSSKLLGFLSSTSQHISNSFLANSQNNATCHALFQLITAATETPLSSFTTSIARSWLEQSIAALRLASKLIELRNRQAQPPGMLETGLLRLVPSLVKTFVVHAQFKVPVMELLRNLVVSASKLDSPPSLLAHLSTNTATDFLKSVRKFGKPLQNQALKGLTWDFATAVVSLQQRWLSIVLLTGSTPRDALKDQRDDKVSKTTSSFLSLAISEAPSISSLEPRYALHLLEFLAQAADYWPWVADRLRNDKASWESLLQFVATLPPLSASNNRSAFTAEQVQMAVHILSIAAVVVHQQADAQDSTFVKDLLNKFDNLIEEGVSTPQYNEPLHRHLNQNFDTRYGSAGCRLSSLKRAAGVDAQLGDTFYYDTAFASKILSFDPAWAPVKKNGFSNEISRANSNFSLVEAQIRFFQSWKSCCAEMTSILAMQKSPTPEFLEKMLRVAAGCLAENGRNDLPEVIFQRLRQSRAELAFTILQLVIPHVKRSDQTEKLLTYSWDLVRESSSELALMLTGDEADYFRTCLRVLYLAMQPHLQAQALSNSRAQYSGRKDKPVGVDVPMLEIVRTVVARGFQSLVSLLHDDPSRALPSDFALLQAILHTALQSPDLERQQETILNIFSDAKTPMYASTLFSWADRLLIDGDPIYGEVSINILLEMSTIVPLAEAIVTSGALGQIATSALSRVYRRGIGQFDQPTRLYGIWTKGILPLAVNLLVAIGPLIGADTANFINQFSGQLEKAGSCLDSAVSQSSGIGAGALTLSMAGEANMLALISSSLLAFKDAGASAGVISGQIPDLAWNRVQVKRDIEDRLSRRNALRESIISTDEREESWLRQKPSDTSLDAENVLEHKIVELLTGALEMLAPAE